MTVLDELENIRQRIAVLEEVNAKPLAERVKVMREAWEASQKEEAARLQAERDAEARRIADNEAAARMVVRGTEQPAAPERPAPSTQGRR